MSWSENVRIETPEQIDFDLEVAGPGNRFVAQFVDWIFKWLILLGLGLIALLFAALLSKGGVDDWSRSTQNAFIAFLVMLGFVIFFGYDIYYEGYRNGQTPGKRIAGIRVVRDSGGPIDATAAAIRNLVGLADFLPMFYLLGGFIMLLNGRSQRLGDMAAGTIVIRERHEETPDDELEHQIQNLANPDVAFTPEHLDRCEPNDIHVLHTFFGRYRDMERQERRRLSEKLCDIFLQKTRYRPLEPILGRVAVMEFLASLYRDLKARKQYR